MSDKKLLTESEIRRFMALANIPALGNQASLKEMVDVGHSQSEDERKHGGTLGALAKSEAAEPEMGGEEVAGDEEMDLGDLGGEKAAGGDKEAKFQELVSMLADLVGVDVEVEAGEKEAEEEMEDAEEAGEEKEEKAGEEKEEKAGEEEEEEADEEEEQEEELDEGTEEEELDETYEEEQEEGKHAKAKHGYKMDEALVNAVLARVTARLLEEAKKKKKVPAADKKKEEMKKKAAAAKHKKTADKKELKEANAPAPKATMSNATKAGVAKGHGPGSKSFGTSEKTDMEWKEGKGGKGHEMKPLAASGGHTVSHTKTSKVTGQGGNKAK